MELGNPWPVANRLNGILLPIAEDGSPHTPDALPLPLKGPWEQWRNLPENTWQMAPRTIWLPPIVGYRPPRGDSPLPILHALTATLSAWSRWVIVAPLLEPWQGPPPWWGDWLAWGDQITTQQKLRFHWVTQQPAMLGYRGASPHWRRGWDPE